MDVTDYNSHKDHAQAVMDHFQRVSELNIIQNVIWYNLKWNKFTVDFFSYITN